MVANRPNGGKSPNLVALVGHERGGGGTMHSHLMLIGGIYISKLVKGTYAAVKALTVWVAF